MWMRTTMNYQYRYGTTTRQALATLYKEGGGGVNGVLRFYKGYLPALAQGPLSRFGERPGNTVVLANASPVLNSTRCLLGAPSLTFCGRFAGDTAANAGMLALLEDFETTRNCEVPGRSSCSRISTLVAENIRHQHYLDSPRILPAVTFS